ncbi:4Fe-4S binding protein [Anaeroselena agilis]|uniref:4Fe-4S dicluster domain-containing protein n=1 Tax=Anaeroselena agilis TaxID=3063788 RepID=A0ABU3P1F3_9FIRM|nr:4Fe-4S dicluster domain-containing protein [Selenomonadales bacterium 4137-cl]
MPVAVDRQLCLNDNYKRIECRRCAAACPHGCFTDGLSVEAARCTDCGLCLAACPADAVTGESFPRAPLDKVLDDPAAPLVFACRRRREDSPWPCLGFVDGRLLLAMFGSGRGGVREVAVDDTACAACRPEVAAHLEATLAEVNRLLLEAGKPAILRGEAAARQAVKERPISRRAFFTALLGATVDTVREVVAAGTAGGERLPRQDWFFRHAGAFAGETPSPFYAAVTIGEACLACGLCVRICPNKALTVEDHGTALNFYHQPGRCTNCGLCAAHCPQGALTVAAPGRPERYHVARRDLPRCEGCGQVYQPVGNQPVCIECLLKSTSRSILPQNTEETPE